MLTLENVSTRHLISVTIDIPIMTFNDHLETPKFIRFMHLLKSAINGQQLVFIMIDIWIETDF
jgi:hypothetical protein